LKRTISIFKFSIKNASNDAVDIHIDGDIVDASSQEIYKNWYGDETSVSFKSFRQAVEAQSAKVYNVYINSGGGLVTDAMAMHDFLVDLQKQGKTVNTIGRGIVASAATYILMAGSAEMTKNSWFMIHNVSGGIWGTVDDVERAATVLRQFNDRSRDFYAEYTQMRKEDITKLMNAETWMTPDEAKAKGFIKKVSSETSFTNSISPERWETYNYSNTAVLNAYNSSVGAPPDKLTQIQNLLTDMKFSFKDVLNAIKGVKPEANADGQAIVNQIAEAMTAPLDAAAEALSNQVTEELTAAETRITNSVTQAFETRIAALETASGELRQANADLEQEVANKLAGPSNTKDEKVKEPKVKGSWSKAVGVE
jgi:ATP-dependent Clp protease protease subunit